MKRNFSVFSVCLIMTAIAVGCKGKKIESEKDSAYIFPHEEVADTNVVLPPSWAFGVLYGGYTNQEQTISRVKEIKAHDYPIDAFWIDSWFWSFEDKGKGPDKYLDFVADTIAFPNRKKMWSFLESQHIKGGFWTWDCILKTGNEEAYDAFDKEGYFSDKYLNKNSWHNNSTSTAMFQDGQEKSGTWCGNIDFNNPQAVAYFKKRMKHFFDEGADFIKLDRTSAVSTSKVMFEMSQEFGKESEGRGFMLAHTGGTDDERYKRYPAKWTDDTRSDWTVETPTKDFNSWVPAIALKENIEMFTNPAKSTSAIPFLTNDTGGFDMGKTDKLDEELYMRWVEFSVFNPIMEVFSQPENTTANLAYKYSDSADSHFKKYAHLRMRLFPYIYSYALATRLEGVNMIRPFRDHLYQFKFGNEFLVAPVYEQAKTERMVYFPEGKWINFWTNKEVDGEKSLLVKAPLKELPLYVKEGSIIPMRKYAGSIEEGSNELLYLHVFPGADGEFTLYEDDGITNDYLKGRIAMTRMRISRPETGEFSLTISPVKGSYKDMPDVRKIQVILHAGRNYSSYVLKGQDARLQEKAGNMETKVFEIDRTEKTTLTFQ